MPPKTAAKTRQSRRSKKPGVAISDAIRLLTDAYGPFENEPRLDPAHELVFTILSQHTSDRNSERAFRNLMHTFGTLEAVAEAEVADIEEAISGGGLARVKAPRIKEVLGMILDLNDGSLDLHFLAEMPMDEARKWLRQLPGIGPKSAGIILSFSLGMPAMAVDTHIFRVSQRLGIIGPKVNADKAHEVLEAAMPPEDVYPFHAAFITHGRQVCKAQRPRCGDCVVSYGCPSRDEEAIRQAAASAEPTETDPVSRETADNDRPDGQAPGASPTTQGCPHARSPHPGRQGAPTVKVGIINVTGYAGCELVRILRHHPEVEIASVTGRSAAGQPLGEVFPHLDNMDLDITADLCDDLDLVFSALPHKASAEACIPLLEQGVKVVDISADFRLKQADVYSQWYGVDHPDPTYLEEAVYGLTELNRDAVADARLVANPGCYPSSAILALAPAIQNDLIGTDIIVDSKSGVSGAGRTLSMTTHFSEVNENVMAYSVNGHRHLP